MTQHCSLCHQDYEKYFQHKKECPGKQRVDCPKCGTVEQQDLTKFIHNEYDRRGGLRGDDGVFGEYLNRGFVEEEKNGYTKYYGCSYWSPIAVDNDTIDHLHTFKRTILSLAKHFPFVFIFKRRAIRVLEEVATAELAKKIPKHWSRVPAELRKGLRKVLPELLADCVAMIPQSDSGYHYRIQDWVINAKKYGIKRAFDLGMERERGKKGGNRWKYGVFKWLFVLGSPMIKKVLNEMDDLYPTDNEKYFAFRRSGYDFLGVPFPERVRWAEARDKELGHVILGNEINL